MWIWIATKIELRNREMSWENAKPKTDDDYIEVENPPKTLHVVRQIYDKQKEIILTAVYITHIPIKYIWLINIQPSHIRAAWTDNGKLCINGHWSHYIFHSYNSYLQFRFSRTFVLRKTARLRIAGLKEADLLDELLEAVSLKL